MLKLRIKKGTTLIETMLCLAVTMIMFISVLQIMDNINVCKKINRDSEKLSNYIDELKIKILSENYNVLTGYTGKRFYVNDNNYNNISSNSLNNIMESSISDEKSYIGISFQEENVIKINMNVKYVENNKDKEINLSFYKGNYK